MIPRDPGAERPAQKTERLPPIPGLSVAEGPVQVFFDAIGFDVVLVYRRALAVRRGPDQPFEIGARTVPGFFDFGLFPMRRKRNVVHNVF